MNAQHTPGQVCDSLWSRANRDHTVWHSENIATPDGSHIRVSVRKYSRVGRAMWRLDGARASLATILAAAEGAETDLLRGNRAAITKALASAP